MEFSFTLLKALLVCELDDCVDHEDGRSTFLQIVSKFYQATRRHNPEDNKPYIHECKDLKHRLNLLNPLAQEADI